MASSGADLGSAAPRFHSGSDGEKQDAGTTPDNADTSSVDTAVGDKTHRTLKSRHIQLIGTTASSFFRTNFPCSPFRR